MIKKLLTSDDHVAEEVRSGNKRVELGGECDILSKAMSRIVTK